MPIYEYVCGSCGHRFEALLTRSDEASPDCPGCGAGRVQKLPSVFAVTRAGSQAPPRACGSGGCSCCG